MGPPKVNNPMFHGSGGWGALQIVGKYDVLDMSDTSNNVLLNSSAVTTSQTPTFVGACATTPLFPGVNTVPQDQRTNAAKVAECGEMKTWIVGVNWWMNDYMRLMFHYSQSDLSGYPTTPISAATEFRRSAKRRV